MPPPYSPPGRCIYCGKLPSADEPLTDEHIIPLALGWRWILPKASCRACQEQTSWVETHCIKGMFASAKGIYRIKGRKSGKPPDFLRVGIEKDAKIEMRKLHISQHPSAIIGFNFGISGAAMGFTPSNDFGGASVCITPLVDNIAERSIAAGPKVQLTNSPINVDVFGRMLAKIAHSFAVAEKGLGGFQSGLENAVLGRSPMCIPYYIGSERHDAEPVSDDRHNLTLSVQNNYVGESMLVARIRLFAQKQTPIYYVTVGRPNA